MYALPHPLSRSSLTASIDKKRKPTYDDDDFIVPDNASDSDAASIPSEGDRRSTSRSSARSVSALDSDEGEEDEVPKRKKAASKPSGKTQASANASSSSFLTAAERSMQDKKLEKKTVEKPFSFLQNVKDKDGVRPGEPGYDPRTIFIPKSSWTEFTPFEKQV